MQTKRRTVRDDQHGTITGYTYGCRCDTCTEANRVKHESIRQAMLADPEDRRHATATGYKYGCRCEACSRANSLADAAHDAAFRRDLTDQRHGTAAGYAYGCACDGCLRAGKAYRAGIVQLLAQDPDDPRHGTSTGYTYGCRCEPCREAKMDSNATSARLEYHSERATHGDLRLFAHGLGLSVPRSGARREALIKRYNREHPDRPYTDESDHEYKERQWQR